MVIQWSDEDQLFLMTIPEFAERVAMTCTHGKTRNEAVRNGNEVLGIYYAPRKTFPSTATVSSGKGAISKKLASAAKYC